MEDEGILVGFAQHHTINYLHQAFCLREARDAAIDNNSELREGFDGKHPLIAQEDFAISFGLNPDKTAIRVMINTTSRCGDLFHKLSRSDRDSRLSMQFGTLPLPGVHLDLHAGDAASNQFWSGHQTGTECTRLTRSWDTRRSG